MGIFCNQTHDLCRNSVNGNRVVTCYDNTRIFLVPATGPFPSMETLPSTTEKNPWFVPGVTWFHRRLHRAIFYSGQSTSSIQYHSHANCPIQQLFRIAEYFISILFDLLAMNCMKRFSFNSLFFAHKLIYFPIHFFLFLETGLRLFLVSQRHNAAANSYQH